MEKKNNRVKVVLSAAIYLLVGGFVLNFCTNNFHDIDLEARVNKRIAEIADSSNSDAKLRSLDLRKIANDFEWDEIYLFKQLTRGIEISKCNPKFYSNNINYYLFSMDVPEDLKKILFVKNNKIIKYIYIYNSFYSFVSYYNKGLFVDYEHGIICNNKELGTRSNCYPYSVSNFGYFQVNEVFSTDSVHLYKLGEPKGKYEINSERALAPMIFNNQVLNSYGVCKSHRL